MPAARKPVHVLEVVGNGIVGGMESVVLRLIERLPRPDFRITVVCPSEGAFSQRVRRAGADCLAVPMPDDPPWSALQAMSALVDSTAVDVLHAHLSNAHTLAALVGQLTRRPVLATVHGRQLTMADLEVHRAAGTHLCTVCHASRLHALGVGAVAERLHCIGNGVDTRQFAPGRGSAPWRGEPTVGFVGRLSPEKGPELFVRTALLLRDRLPKARFVLVGEGPLRGACEQLVSRHRLGNRVVLAGVHDDMPAVYRNFDLLVSSSHSEAMPLAVLEAQACGVPVVATRVGGVPDVVEHGGSGLLVDPGNADALADAVARLVDHADERQRMAAQARRRAVELFDIERSVASTAALLLRLAAANAACQPTAAMPLRSSTA